MRRPQEMWQPDLGARVNPDGVPFKVWAPKRRRVEVVIEEGEQAFPLERDGNGYFPLPCPM